MVTLTLGYDIRHGGKHAIDYLTHYQNLDPHPLTFGHTAEIVDPVGSVSGVAGGFTESEIPQPSGTDSANSWQDLRYVDTQLVKMTLFGGTLCGPIVYNMEGALTATKEETSIDVSFVSTNATAVLAWGGHIAAQFDHGQGNSASSISGSPYHMRTLDWTLNSLGNQDRSLKASAVVVPGRIIIIKDAVPNDAQDFMFNLSGGPVPVNKNFDLDDDGAEACGGTPPDCVGALLRDREFAGLAPSDGTDYVVAETPEAGWVLSNIVCQRYHHWGYRLFHRW